MPKLLHSKRIVAACIAMLLSIGGWAQQVTITGRVISKADQMPLPGAYLVEKGTNNGTITDLNGTFSLKVAEKAVLICSFIGYNKQEIQLGSQREIQIALDEDAKTLDDVVVIGYGTQKKANLTGSVGSVEMKEIASRPIINAGNALQGKISGVYALQSSGKPGDDGAVINIRGVGTINGTTPLVLIDGFPGEMSSVNPMEIESISVLKDAASSAIYGSRAANGVVLLTTKKGSSQKIKVSYDAYVSNQSPTSLPSVFDSYDYATLYNEAAINAGQSAKFTASEIQKYKDGTDPLYPNINYFDVYYGKAALQNHHINLSGGSDNLKFAFMAGYLNQDGVLVKTGYEKYNIRTNFDAYLLKDKKLRISAKFAGDMGTQKAPTDEWSAKWYADNAPIFPLKNADGNWMAVNGERNFYAEIMEGSIAKLKKSHFNAQFEAAYTIYDGLTAEVNYGFDWTQIYNHRYWAATKLYNPNGSSKTTTSALSESNNQGQRGVLNAILRYSKTFDKKHEVNVLGGYSEEYYQFGEQGGYRNGFVNNTQQYIDLGTASSQTNYGNAYDAGLKSLFGRIGYVYDTKYLLEANVRKDGTSRFAPDMKWAVFPSFSAGWRVSQESFLKNLNWLNNLKLRASWGKLGNQGIDDPYTASSVLSSGQAYTYGGSLVSGVAVTNLKNVETTWETTTQSNAGVDLSFLNQFDITFDYFNKKTEDVLMKLPIPLTMGNLGVPYQNVGAVSNKGVEFSVSWHKSLSNGMKLNSTFNISHIKNEVTDLHGQEMVLNGVAVLKVGEAVNSFYGYKTDGLYQVSDFTWQNGSDASIPHAQRVYTLKPGVVTVANYNAQPGDLKFKDLDGDGKVTMDKDRQVIGKQFPDFTYSWQFNAEWKNFDFSMFFQGVSGIQGYTYQEISTPFSNFSNTGSWWKDRWTIDNPNTSYPRLTLDQARTNINSSFYVEDASYLRLKNIELGYTVPSKWMAKTGFERLRVYGSIQNAFTITNYKGFDPEKPVNETRAQAYPQVRILTMGLNVNF